MILYAIAYNRRTRKGLVPGDIEYLHAMDQAHAKALFIGAQPAGIVLEIIAIAPVIGYHVDDEHGEKLSV